MRWLPCVDNLAVLYYTVLVLSLTLAGRSLTHFKKRTLTGEGGTRVRAFVHSPNLLPPSFAGTSYDGIISASDIFPTFCAVAGVKPRENKHQLDLVVFVSEYLLK